MSIIANVTTNAGMRSRVTASPFSAPITMPLNTPTLIATPTPTPRAMTSAQSTPARPTMDPTDRSMAPETMTKVIPAARTAVKAFCRRTLPRLLLVRKPSVVSVNTSALEQQHDKNRVLLNPSADHDSKVAADMTRSAVASVRGSSRTVLP